MLKFIIGALLVYIDLLGSGLSNCSYKYEYKDATVVNSSKNVIDYTSTLSRQETTYSEIIGGYHNGSDLADCVLYDGEYWWKDICGDGHSCWSFATSRSNWGHCTPNSSTTTINYCPNGYGTPPCKKTIYYTYKQMTCNGNDKNTQGYGWELTSAATNNGVKTDPDNTADNSSTLDDTIKSHSSSKDLCKRTYQECQIDCTSPLTLDKSTGKCYMSYSKSCEEKGMSYNSKLNKCEKTNQCGDPNAYGSDSADSFCQAVPNCIAKNGVCGEDAIKSCEDNSFSYSSNFDKCIKNTSCTSSQYVLEDSTCGSVPFCEDGDMEESRTCVKKTVVKKTCLPYNRSGNLCFQGEDGESPIIYRRPLVKITVSGSYKEEYFGQKLNILCTENSDECKFRLTDIFVENEGKKLCFQDLQGVKGCIDIHGDCVLDGEIHNKEGIKQILIENGNKLVAYNLIQKEDSLGAISSTCTLSGKVGDIAGIYKSSDIISAKANDTDIEFWDAYQRELIGVISFVPTIPEDDINEGFSYEDKDVMQLFSNNFTGFYSKNNATYAVYNGEISKSECQRKIDGTSFYIPFGATDDDDLIVLKGMSLYRDNFNYLNGDESIGSCVVKSQSAQSFKTAQYSIKKISIPVASSQYICSPFICKNGSCQYNTCANGFSPTVYEQDFFEKVIGIDYGSILPSEACTKEKCDSNLPYFRYCGNSYGCKGGVNIYQQEDGTCVQVSCKEENETLDVATGKCVSFGCVNSVEEDGKCFKTLNLK